MKTALSGVFSFSDSKLIFQEESQVVSDGREGCSGCHGRCLLPWAAFSSWHSAAIAVVGTGTGLFGAEAACEVHVEKAVLRARVEESGVVRG